MTSAESRMSMRPGRKSVAPIGYLVTQLNWLQNAFTRDNVMRSNKRTEKARGSEFIHLCCQKVGVSKGQVDRALRRNISQFHMTLAYGADLSSVRGHRSSSKRGRLKLKSRNVSDQKQSKK
jgi:hypothetical protein